MRTSVYVYVYRFTCAFIYMYIVLNSRPFPYFYFFFFLFRIFFYFPFLFSYTCTPYWSTCFIFSALWNFMKFIAKNTLKGATNEKCLSSTICRALSTRYPPSPFTIHGFIYTTRHIIPRKSEIHLLLGIIHGVPLPGNVFSLLFYFILFSSSPSSYSFLPYISFFFSFLFFPTLSASTKF